MRRLYQQGRVNALTLKAERNFYHYTIRQGKSACWADFLQKWDEILGDSEWCWTALRYTRPCVSSATPALIDPEGNTGTSLEEKAEMVGRTAFPLSPSSGPAKISNTSGGYGIQAGR